MGTTTFSGPIKAGNVLNTTGTAADGKKVNVGSVVVAQSVAWQQTTTADTGMVIPANSQILEIELLITTQPTAADLTIGNATDGAQIGTALALGTTDDLVLKFSAGDTTDLWADVGTADTPVWVTSSTGTAGRGVLTVSYIQNNNITLIA